MGCGSETVTTSSPPGIKPVQVPQLINGEHKPHSSFSWSFSCSAIFSTELGSQLSSIQQGYDEISKQKTPKITARTFILQKYGF